MSVKPYLNKEGHADKALAMLDAALKDETTVFRNRILSNEKKLEAADYCANLLEEEKDLEAIRAFAYKPGLILKKYCKIF